MVQFVVLNQNCSYLKARLCNLSIYLSLYIYNVCVCVCVYIYIFNFWLFKFKFSYLASKLASFTIWNLRVILWFIICSPD